MLRIPVESNASRAASAWVEVDLGVIMENSRALLARLPRGCRLSAVVKSEAYGHGMLQVARAAVQAGAHELVVATVLEGAALRAGGVHAPILVAGPITPEEGPLVVQHGLVASVASVEVALALSQATRRYLPVQLEVDTGMSRHGVSAAGLRGLVQAITERGRLSIAGVFTHLAGLGPQDAPEMRAQVARFCAAVAAVPALRGVRRHACNTLATMLLPEASLDGVRVGGGLYGFDPLDGRGPGQLGRALTLKSKVVGLRQAVAGDRVGYGGAFQCERPTQLALLPLGYGDGLARELWRGADVLIRGRRAPIVGLVSMNQTVVDVTDLPEVVLGEEVVLLGKMGDHELTPEQRAPAGTSAYEVTSLLSPRLPRVFVRAPSSTAERPPLDVHAIGRESQTPRSPRR